MIELRGKYSTAKVFTDNIEETAVGQIIELCNQEFTKNNKIRIMPDTHAGAGCTIGTTMTITQQFAQWNRKAIVDTIVKKMKFKTVDQFTTIHNYIDTDNMILRKGAISAQQDEKVIIPINMRDGSIIAVGRGNPEWNYSAPHGAGRLMSRSKAKENITMKQFKDSMKGIFTTSIDTSTIDESPMAYKPMEEIIDNIQDSVEILDIIKPVYNFKAAE